jgi:membrane protein DedA with SNARE-associated domain
MNYETLIADYGYLAILIGMFVEGETVLLLGGLAARLGFLDFRWVLATAGGSALLSDQLFFHLGRYHGTWVLARFPRLQLRAGGILARVHRHQTLLTVGFRFLYGCRTITPILLGSCGVRPLRFGMLNIAGVAVWTAVFGLLGYTVGEAAVHLLGHVKHHEIDLVLVLLAAGACWHLILRIRARRQLASKTAAHDSAGTLL